MDKIFNKPFAINGTRVAIPENGTENERVSFDKGFTQPYEVEAPSVDNPGGQGFNILRPEMNEALYQLSSACNFLAENIDKWTALTTENLNDIQQAGRYYQNKNVNATNERNYPINSAGYLIVLNTTINTWGVTQIYVRWNSEKVYIRRTTSDTTWSAWDSLVLTTELNSAVTRLQNTDTNLSNNKEDKTKFTNGIINATTNSNLDNLAQNGFYWRTTNTGSPLPTTNGGAVIVNTNGRQVIQYFYTDTWDLNNGGAWFRTRDAASVWTAWHHLENSEHTEATYRKIADSYTKAQCDSTFLTIATANLTYRKIADSYTKSEVYTKNETNSLVVAGGTSRTGYTPANIANATLPIPNKSVITGCCIMVTGIYNIGINGEIDTDFIFKIDDTEIGRVNLSKNGQTGAGIGTFHLINQRFFSLSGKLGKTIVPSIVQNSGSITRFNFLVVWQ